MQDVSGTHQRSTQIMRAMPMINLQSIFTSVEQATAFTESQRTTLQRRNEDLRTLGQGKALHALAETLGYSNWHAMKHALDALMSNKESTTSTEKISSPETNTALSILKDIESLSKIYNELDDDEDLDLADEKLIIGELLVSFGSGLTVTVNIALGSGIGIQMEVDPHSNEVIDAHVSVSGFEGTILKQVPSEHLDILARRFADEIENELLSLITG